MPKEPTSWGGVADWYDKLLGDEDSFQSKVLLPNLARLLAVTPGTRMIDVACGQGFFSHAFAALGADVTGIDVSEELIAIARKPATAKGPGKTAFYVAPSHQLGVVASGAADKAMIVLAIQNIADVKGTFAECARALASRGTLHLVLNHPSFRVPKGSSWEWDERGAQYRRVDRYMTEAKVKIQMHPGDAPSVTTVSFHRPLQFYVKALAKAGFAVTNLEEWTSHKKSDSGPRAAEENRARKEIPIFMYLEAKKLS